MKIKNLFFLNILLLLTLTGCKQNNTVEINQQNGVNEIVIKEANPNKYIVDSYKIREFGANGTLKLKQVSTYVPQREVIQSEYKVYPGTSYLRQNLEQKLSRESQIKSKPPVIIPYNNDNVRKISVNDITIAQKQLLEPLIINFDGINDFKRIAISKGNYLVADGDTILPPMKFIPGHPTLIKTESPGYKYDALTNISNISRDQKLPNSFVRKIVMTDNDVIWLGTAGGGIMSYDGQFIKQYTKEHGLQDDDIYTMMIDSKGRIWAGTHRAGLICYDGKYFTNYSMQQGLLSNRVISLFEDSKGNIWFGTDSELVKFKDNTLNFLPKYEGIPDSIFMNISEDSKGNLWFASRLNGILKLAKDSIYIFNESNGLASNRTLYSFEDSKQNMWFCTNGGGISKFDGKNFVNYGYDQGLGHNTILCIDEDENGHLWIATSGNGVTRFDGQSFRSYIDEDGLLDNYIRTLFVDKYNEVWIGTDGVGLSILKPDRIVQLNKKHGLTNDLVLSIYQDNKERIWLGTFNGGVLVYEQPRSPNELPTLINISTRHGLNDSLIVSINQDSENNYWIASFRGGMSKIDYKSFENGILEITNYGANNGLNSDNVNKVYQDSKGNIWAGTRLGPCIITDSGIISLKVNGNLNESEIVDIYEDMSGALWFGSYGSGLYRLKNDTISHFTKENGLADDAVWSINQTVPGTVVFGTDMGFQFINSNKIGLINTSNGFSNNQIYSITPVSENEMWIGTTVGLNRLVLEDPFNSSNTVPSISYYDKYDGLISDDFYHNSALLDNDGWLWFGTLKGLIRFDPASFINNNVEPKIRLVDMKLNNRTYNYSALKANRDLYHQSNLSFDKVDNFSNLPLGLKIPHNENHLTFYFSSTDWNSPSKINNSYMLEGFDNDWNETSGENHADYRNLPSGKYTLRLKAANIHGISSNELAYSFTVLPPWYYTWWALLVYIILLFVFIYGIVRIRVSSIQDQKRTLEKTVKERTKELNNALKLANQAGEAKNQFIATVSHELRTPLNAIMGLSHLALKSTKDFKLKDYLKKIDSSSRTLLILINDILDFSKMESGKMKLEKTNFDLDSVLRSVIELNAQTAQNKGLDFNIIVNQDIPQYLIGDPLRIGQILTNLCNNAIKFTEHGKVILKLEKEEEVGKSELFIHVTVEDTGIGISDEQIPQLFDSFQQADTSISRKYGGTGLGLSIAKLFIEMMEGEIWLESEPDKGTKFHFNFKAGVQEEKYPEANLADSRLKGISSLICSDDQVMLDAITRIFNHHSIEHFIAVSYDDLKAKLNECSTDILIIDEKIIRSAELDPGKLPSNISNQIKNTLVICNIGNEYNNPENNIGFITKPVIASDLIEKIIQISNISNDHYDIVKIESQIIKKLEEQLNDKRILIAEDNDLNSQVLIELSEVVGIITERVSNGSQAIEKAMENNYDLILMDLHMPSVDGLIATKELRKQGIKTPIIAITADIMETVIEKCRSAGMNDILTKPIDPEKFYNQLKNWLINDDRSKDLKSGDYSELQGHKLNINDGIKRLGNNRALYFKMLNKFHRSMFRSYDKILSAYDNEDYETAFLLTHSLKGESGNLGLYEVINNLEEIEESLKNKNFDVIKNHFNNLHNKFLNIETLLSNILSSETSKTGQVVRPIDDIIKELNGLIKTNSHDVFNLIDELEENYSSINRVDRLIVAVRKGDLQDAAKIIETFYK